MRTTRQSSAGGGPPSREAGGVIEGRSRRLRGRVAVIRSQQIPGAGRHVAVYLDSQINLEVGVELDAPFSGSGEVVSSGIPAGLVATTTHYGPYGLLNKAHEAILRWCGDNGQTLAGPNWEIYGHWQDEWNSDPTKICTEVFYLITWDGSSAA